MTAEPPPGRAALVARLRSLRRIDALIDRSSIGRTAWVDCAVHGRTARDPDTRDPDTGRCVECADGPAAERSGAQLLNSEEIIDPPAGASFTPAAADGLIGDAVPLRDETGATIGTATIRDAELDASGRFVLRLVGTIADSHPLVAELRAAPPGSYSIGDLDQG